MKYLTVEDKGTPEEFMEMFDKKLAKLSFNPVKVDSIKDTLKLTYSYEQFCEILQTVYTSGYVRGQKGRPYDLRQKREVKNSDESHSTLTLITLCCS